MVAIALATILILVTAMIFKQASRAFSQSDARNEVYQNVRAAFDIVKRDVSGATLNTRYELFKAFDNIDASDYSVNIAAKEGSDILVFLSSTPNNNNQPITLITYYLKDNNILYKLEKTDTHTLNTDITSFNIETETGYKELGLNVSTLQFRYQDSDGTWEDTWDTGTNTAYQYLPDAVEVEMMVSDTLGRFTGTSTNIISIP
ncbi:tRNA delta(2)-isopentenylpyrophosphate transferase [Candidatus Scalindua japonica]|uniref:tRNA delta(2)-isopentenylpyrophosphate transferase n=2 Tax=Candidatus Scalindua japonica TaxID=1284222 RepID=A0A286TY93_9BACT|nr:tRNA delta(2)-isopentenylpyrophosphate transferase [Candidatus Scalindua japonica]